METTFDGTDVHFAFGIPQGVEGAIGPEGPQGPEGPEGETGPPFANAVVDGVTTLDPGEPAVSFPPQPVISEANLARGGERYPAARGRRRGQRSVEVRAGRA